MAADLCGAERHTLRTWQPRQAAGPARPRSGTQLLGFSREDAMEHGLALIPAEYRARHVAGFHAAVDSGHLAHDGLWRGWRR